ncbi:MCE family protein [Nocardioides zeae]|uniref:MCE family protein n=1 Tax=Nocardioides zeae TaxID=1457234 RepID=A0A6P0HG34_9ACTN|nr:MCE family protein [Nocardioides zeae]NEN77598.1 MCE family protein [Nocardioides zeae]
MSVRGAALKLVVFGAVGALMLALLYLTLGRITLGPRASYNAVMADVSGLEAGDLVRIAGVRVGQVEEVGFTDVDGRQLIEVRFSVDEGQTVTDATHVLVRYENLLGDRYLELAQPAGQGAPLEGGSTIPLDRTTAALDLDTLLNGFAPLFEGLDPAQVNQLASGLVSTLQGRGGTLQSLLAGTASLTSTLADQDVAIGSLVDNLGAVLATVDERDGQLSDAIVQLRSLLDGLAADREPLGVAVSSVGELAGTLTGLLQEVRPPLAATVDGTAATAGVVNANGDTLEEVLNSLPGAYATLGRVASHGNFFNFFLCSVQVVVGTSDLDVRTPVVRSNAARCN